MKILWAAMLLLTSCVSRPYTQEELARIDGMSNALTGFGQSLGQQQQQQQQNGFMGTDRTCRVTYVGYGRYREVCD